MQALYLAAAGFLSWTVSSHTAGVGSVLFIALLALIVENRAVAPIVTHASLIAAPLPAFVPLSLAVGLISALVGASGLVASPFYLNYGLIEESLLAAFT